MSTNKVNQASKAGRSPISQKTNEITAKDLEFYNNDDSILRLSPVFTKMLGAKGLAYRWINASKYRLGGNFHKNGWRAYKYSTEDGDVDQLEIGVTPEGFLLRLDNILAVMPKGQAEARKLKVQDRAKRMSGSQKNNAEELRERAGRGAKIIEGFEANGGSGSDE